MRKSLFGAAPAVVLFIILVVPASAGAAFGLKDLEVTFSEQSETAATQAGSHPFSMRTAFRANTQGPAGAVMVDGATKDLEVELPRGFAGNPTATPRCQTVDFLSKGSDPFTDCSDSTAVGYTRITTVDEGEEVLSDRAALYNLQPPPGAVAKLGFWASDIPVTLEVGLSLTPPYNVVASARNISQVLRFSGSETIVWGNPANPAHDELRGERCLALGGICPAGVPERPFITLPRSCSGSLETVFRARPWWDGDFLSPSPGSPFRGSALTLGMGGCAKVGFAPRMNVQPTTENAESPSGLEVNLEIDDEGLDNPTGIARSDIKEAIVALPEGVTVNPSMAEGLAVCSPQDLERETLDSDPGDGCPQASKVGTVEVESPLLEGELIKGVLFIATPFENPFDTLLAVYIVIKHPELGILVKLPGRVEPHARTGQLVTTFEDLPQIPFSAFRLRLREGGRSPLVSPATCGSKTTVSRFVPWANPESPLSVASTFQITRGVGGGACPPAGPPPFAPGFIAGTLNNNAGSHSPLYLRLTRRDGDQDLTRFSADLPPGLVASLAGVDRCSNAAIAVAKAKDGKTEIASPSCPVSSEIGSVIGGAGVGSQLTYVPGKLYLAGPIGSAPLSVVAIVPAVAGPFDVGTVVVRQALQINPRTAKVRVDSSLSDPIPHVLAGIPLKVRDVRVHADRPRFTLNPTSCDPFEVGAEAWGGGGNPFDTADDVPVSLAERFQSANCSRLPFKPRLSLRLEGGMRRGDNPKLQGVYRPKRGHANLANLALRLPRSAFLDQDHIRTICTRVQFVAERCPKAAIYGRAIVATPLLDKPLRGPVYLRSSRNDLPDLVADLHGLVDVEAVGRIDSHRGGIRVTFSRVPDAPVSKVVVRMQGGAKGLVINSTDLCRRTVRARLGMTAHNGRQRGARILVRSGDCGRSK
jgi:hypothetical protein